MTYLKWGQLLSGGASSLPPDSPLFALLAACESHPDFDVVELRAAPGGQEWHAVVVDAGDGTVASRNNVGIHPRERLMLLRRPGADMPYEVRTLRRDFPKTLHQNGVPNDEPRSLCLYDQPWSSLERTWTPAKFLTRVLQWLEKTADGSLHAPEQVLEPLFFESVLHVLLPVGFEAAIHDASQTLRLRVLDRAPKRITLAAIFDTSHSNLNSVPMQPLTFEIPSVAHPPIQELPRTLGELEDCLAQVGSSLFPTLTDALRGAAAAGLSLPPADNQTKALLLPRVPRTRDGHMERVDVLGFVVEADLARLGLSLGVLHQAQPGGSAFPVHVLSSAGISASTSLSGENWKAIELYQIHVRHRVNRAAARLWSGVEEPKEGFRGTLAGCGALGSAIALLWAREAWGSWTVVDPDVIEPHNPVRHQAFDSHAGLAKAEVVAMLMRFALGEEDPQTRAIRGKANDCANEEVRQVLASADLLIDASTTLEVPRDWSLQELPRSASMFLTPSGSASVLLLEDEARTLRLAALEAQYYRAILRNKWGATHLESPASLSVGAGCRDRSVILSSTQIGLHAALLNRGLRRAIERPVASIRVWSTDAADGGVQCLNIPTSTMRCVETPHWTVCWDEALEMHLHALRAAALPLETGGVLVGVTDHKARTIYLVDGYPAPSDSIASEHEFIRGREGVAECRLDCVIRTRGMVDYVGDWHSHPRGTPATPSRLDLQLVGSLAESLAADGIPAVMVIAGHNGDLTVTLCE